MVSVWTESQSVLVLERQQYSQTSEKPDVKALSSSIFYLSVGELWLPKQMLLSSKIQGKAYFTTSKWLIQLLPYISHIKGTRRLPAIVDGGHSRATER